MSLTKVFVGERDKREKEIENLLEKTLEKWPENGLTGRGYLDQAIAKKEEIEKEKGKIYFKKYPEISQKIDAVVVKLFKDECNSNEYKS